MRTRGILFLLLIGGIAGALLQKPFSRLLPAPVGVPVIAPAVLFEELELQPVKEETPKPPIVPPPALTGQSSATARAPVAHARGSEPRPSGSGG